MSKAASSSSSGAGSVPAKRVGSASKEEVDEMREVFSCFDKDASGKVTTSELGLVLRSMNKNFNEDQLKKIVGRFDSNGDGQIDFDEFFAMMTRYERKEVDELQAAFNVFDRDGDGTISAKELEMIMKALGENIDRETIDLMIESVDTDKNGFIDFNEFKQMMKDGPPPADAK